MARSARRFPEKTLVREARAAVETCAVGNARLAARRLTQFLTDRMKGSGLGVAQFWLMTQIAAASDDSLGALARSAGLDQSTLSRNLQVLERDGLVEMAAGETDSRRRAVWLTEAGAQRLEIGPRRMAKSPHRARGPHRCRRGQGVRRGDGAAGGRAGARSPRRFAARELMDGRGSLARPIAFRFRAPRRLPFAPPP